MFTEDAWHTVQDAPAEFRERDDFGIEWWEFSAPLSGATDFVECAVACTVDGKTCGDNNFGQNY